MTREEAIIDLEILRDVAERWADTDAIALTMAIEALKAQDKPIICPRCGRVFAVSEGQEEMSK